MKTLKCSKCKELKFLNMFDKRRELYIDHDHNTNKVRGLLCSNCNTALGKFKDDILILEEAIRYLKISRQN